MNLLVKYIDSSTWTEMQLLFNVLHETSCLMWYITNSDQLVLLESGTFPIFHTVSCCNILLTIILHVGLIICVTFPF